MKNSKEKSYMTYPRWHKEKIIELRFPDSYISIKLSSFLYVYSQAHTCTHIHAQTQTHMHTHAHKYSKPCVTTASSWKLKDCRNLHRNKIFSSSVKPQFEAKVSWAESSQNHRKTVFSSTRRRILESSEQASGHPILGSPPRRILPS